MKEIFGIIMRNRAEKFQLDLRCGKYTLPQIEKGNDHFLYKVNDAVLTTNLSIRKSGLTGKVIDRYKENGYAKYIVVLDCGEKIILRNQDICINSRG